ncbi:MAG: hypothetical protein RMM31_06425 [Anaerolineae bacterium]|nr:hypothetical protein [Thermoflexales bacterium]MDW8395858.1 hypothetical protein [Anaerolineae bacterium]
MKFTKRVSFLVPALALALSACGAPSAEVDKSGDFYLALPRVEVVLDDKGVPSIAGLSADAVRTLTFGTVDLSLFAVPADYVAWLKSTNTQHIELAFNGSGAFIYVNGKALPHIEFDNTSIANTGEVALTITDIFAPGFQGYASLAKRFLPLARSLGLGLVIRLPKQDGVAEIPLRELGAPKKAVEPRPDTSSVQARIVVDYDANGVPSVADISVAEIEQLFGLDLLVLKLDPNFVRAMTNKGIQHLSIRSEGNGLALAVNDKPLPNLVCDADCLTNTANVISTLNTYEALQINGATIGMKEINQIVKQFGPELRNVDIELALRFPLAPGSQRIPLPFASMVN